MDVNIAYMEHLGKFNLVYFFWKGVADRLQEKKMHQLQPDKTVNSMPGRARFSAVFTDRVTFSKSYGC